MKKSLTLKVLTHVISILFLMCLALPSKAVLLQQVTWQDLITHSTYIFEGTVTSSTAFIGADSNIYTNNTVHLTRQVQGSLMCGDVEVVTVGGTVGDEFQYVPGALSLTSGTTYIFFCNVAHYPSQTAPVANPVALEVYSDVQGVVQYNIDTYAGDTAFHWYWGDLPNINTLYLQISALTGFTFTPCYEKQGEHKTEQTTENITFTIDSVQLIQSGITDSVKFSLDVMGNMNNTYLNDGEIYIQYNSTVFSTTAYNKCVITAPIGTYNFTTSASGTGQFVLHFSSSDGYTITNVNNKSKSFICHITMPVITCDTGKSYLTNFGTDQVSSGDTYFNTNSFGTTGIGSSIYTEVFGSKGPNVKSCNISPPSISSLHAHSGPSGYYAGGIQQQLDIIGSNFGTTKGTIYFTDASLGVPYYKLDPSQYVKWHNDTVTVIIPSIIGGGIAASGWVKLQKANLEYDTMGITIKYSALTYKNADGKYHNVALRSENSSGGYTFVMNDSFHNNLQYKTCFRDAINEWECQTRVNFVVTDTFTSQSHDMTTPHSDNTVSFGFTPNGMLSWSFFTYKICSYSVGSQTFYHNVLKQIDIVVSGTLKGKLAVDPAHNNQTSINPNSYDVQTIFEHEIGHAIGLCHTANGNASIGSTQDMMYYQLLAGQVRGLHVDDTTGAKYQLREADSTWLLCTGPGFSPMTNLTICYSGVEYANYSLPTLNVSPNPFDNVIYLNIDEEAAKSSYYVSVSDLTGKTVYENRNYMFGTNLGIDLGFLKSGVYMLRASNAAGSYVVKINKL